MSTSIVLVTYNRIKLLKKSLNCIRDNAKNCNEIIIVDNNSTDETFSYLQNKFNLNISKIEFDLIYQENEVFEGSWDNKKIVLIKLKENTGGSGGFYAGVKYFYECSNSEWMWGMDDDAFVEPGSLDELELAIKQNPDVYAFWSNCNNDTSEKKYDYVKGWMFVGFCINKYLISKVGLPVHDYFIYHDDSEYSSRIIRNKFKIIKVISSKIQHGDLSNRKYWTKKILWKNMSFPAMDDWKLYYYFRNNIHKSSYSKIKKISKIIHLYKVAFRLYLINPQKIKVVLMAIHHGIINKKGKYLEP